MAELIYVFIMIWFSYTNAITSANDNLTNFTKIENPANVYVGSKHIQKIKELFIDDGILSCKDKHLPIIFVMLDGDKKSVEVKGWLTQHGNFIYKQGNISDCSIYKRFIIY